jgi:hypothetical protein
MPTQYGTAKEIEGYKQTINQIEGIQENPYLAAQISDPREFKKRKQDVETQLAKREAPAPKDDKERVALRGRQEMLEAFIRLECTEISKPAMPTQHEMWETPAGAVGKHSLWENKLKNYSLDQNGNPVQSKDGHGAIFEWKDNQRRLRGEEEQWDPDIANVEKLRPQNADKSSFADYKKILTAGSPQFKEKYDEAFPDHEPTPVEAKIESAKIKCSGKKSDGEPCGSFPMKGTTFCRKHQEIKSEVEPQPEA